MIQPLIVIVGAGASHESGYYGGGDRPPLTRELFRTGRAVELLRTYTLAQAAGRAIERAMEADDVLQFEAALRQLQDDGYQHHHQMAMAVAPFLQALLIQYSSEFGPYSHRYGVLVDELLKVSQPVNFVSLNYDTLLDTHLDALSPLTTLESYTNTPLGWRLIKPHGSVAWYVPQNFSFDPAAPLGDLVFEREPIECVRVKGITLGGVRGKAIDFVDDHGATSRYPAIALPDGPKDQLMLPDGHLAAMEETLVSPEIQLLVLGYSALDTEILNLISGAGGKVRRLTVVNKGAEDALEVYGRIVDAGIEPIWSDVYDGSLAEWIDGDGLTTWVAEYDGPFHSILAPEQLEERLERRKEEAQADALRRVLSLGGEPPT